MLLNSAVRALLPSNDRNSSWIYPSTILVHSQHVLSIFDRVPKAMYINDPINSLYGVFLYGFSSNSSCASVSFNFDSTDRGVFTGLLSFMIFKSVQDFLHAAPLRKVYALYASYLKAQTVLCLAKVFYREWAP